MVAEEEDTRGDIPIVRRVIVADTATIARIHVDSRRAAYEGLLPEEVLAARSVEEREVQWRERITRESPDTFVTVATVGGRVAGFLCAGAARDDDLDPAITAEIQSLYVAPVEWRRGVGRALVREALADLEQAGWRDVVLWSLAGNERAARFYGASGFTERARRARTVAGHEASYLRWYLELGPTARKGASSR